MNDRLEKEALSLLPRKNLEELCFYRGESLDGCLANNQEFQKEFREKLKRIDLLQRQNELAIHALKLIRNNEWGTDYCDSKNMLADKALTEIAAMEKEVK